MTFEDSFYEGPGDDCVAIKSGIQVNWTVPYVDVCKRPSKMIRVNNVTCVAAHGVTIGSEISGGVEDVRFTNMRLLASPGNGVAMVKLKNECGRGGFVRGIHWENLTAGSVGNGIYASRYGTAPTVHSCNASGTIRFSNLTARNIFVEDAVYSAYAVGGYKTPLAQQQFVGFSLENFTVRKFKALGTCENADVKLSGPISPAFPPCTNSSEPALKQDDAGAERRQPALCSQIGVRQDGVTVEGRQSTPYTLALATFSECVASCNQTADCVAVVFKGTGVSGNPSCGQSNETCCYRLSTCEDAGSHTGLSSAWSSFVFAPRPFRCGSDTDCSMAGRCNKATGHCSCAPGFAGRMCAALDLRSHAAAAYDPLPDHTQRKNTWCGSLIQAPETGLWHGFFTAMLDNCPVVDTFYQNGYILHATSMSPFGPFSNGSEVLPNWSTQPEIHFDPSSGTYVLMHSRFDSMKKRTNNQVAAFPCGKDGRKAPPPEGFDPKPKEA